MTDLGSDLVDETVLSPSSLSWMALIGTGWALAKVSQMSAGLTAAAAAHFLKLSSNKVLVTEALTFSSSDRRVVNWSVSNADLKESAILGFIRPSPGETAAASGILRNGLDAAKSGAKGSWGMSCFMALSICSGLARSEGFGKDDMAAIREGFIRRGLVAADRAMAARRGDEDAICWPRPEAPVRTG